MANRKTGSRRKTQKLDQARIDRLIEERNWSEFEKLTGDNYLELEQFVREGPWLSHEEVMRMLDAGDRKQQGSKKAPRKS